MANRIHPGPADQATCQLSATAIGGGKRGFTSKPNALSHYLRNFKRLPATWTAKCILVHVRLLNNRCLSFIIVCRRCRLEESLIDMFKNKGKLEEGKLRKTHEIVKALLDSDFGSLVYGRLKVGKDK